MVNGRLTAVHLKERRKRRISYFTAPSRGCFASSAGKVPPGSSVHSIYHFRSGTVGVYNRVVNEARTGKYDVDIIELSAGPVSELIRGGCVDTYRSSETDPVRPVRE